MKISSSTRRCNRAQMISRRERGAQIRGAAVEATKRMPIGVRHVAPSSVSCGRKASRTARRIRLLPASASAGLARIHRDVVRCHRRRPCPLLASSPSSTALSVPWPLRWRRASRTARDDACHPLRVTVMLQRRPKARAARIADVVRRRRAEADLEQVEDATAVRSIASAAAAAHAAAHHRRVIRVLSSGRAAG